MESITIEDIDTDKVRITDRNGETMTLTANEYYDIIDANTHAMYARSDLPHDTTPTEYQLPTDWHELDHR
jgi:hypothetical protein